MLVVMLIIMVATATAAMSVQSTQYELQAAGHERNAVQTRYLAETTLLTTAAWFDKVFDPVSGGGFGVFYDNCANRDYDSDMAGQQGPRMWLYGQPEVNLATQAACRLNWHAMSQIEWPRAINQVHPITLPADPTLPNAETVDFSGSLGPKHAYQPERASASAIAVGIPSDFFVDLVCRPEVVEAGTIVAGTPTATRTRRYHCVVTARARLSLPGVDVSGEQWLPPDPTHVDPLERGWAIGANTFPQNPFSTQQEMRMTVLTPEEVF